MPRAKSRTEPCSSGDSCIHPSEKGNGSSRSSSRQSSPKPCGTEANAGNGMHDTSSARFTLEEDLKFIEFVATDGQKYLQPGSVTEYVVVSEYCKERPEVLLQHTEQSIRTHFLTIRKNIDTYEICDEWRKKLAKDVAVSNGRAGLSRRPVSAVTASQRATRSQVNGATKNKPKDDAPKQKQAGSARVGRRQLVIDLTEPSDTEENILEQKSVKTADQLRSLVKSSGIGCRRKFEGRKMTAFALGNKASQRENSLCTTPKKKQRSPQKKVEKPDALSPEVSVRPARTHLIKTPEEDAKPGRKHRGGNITDYFSAVRKPQPEPLSSKEKAEPSVRISSRRLDRLKKASDKSKELQRLFDGVDDDGIEIRVFPEKGRGLVAAREFQKDEFVVEYAGDLIKGAEVAKREALYASQPEKYGCYMYYFKHKETNWCVDATAETGRYGRLLNHSRSAANLRTEIVEIDVPKTEGKTKVLEPRLILRANRDIRVGEEFLYDYGDRDLAVLVTFPWLKD